MAIGSQYIGHGMGVIYMALPKFIYSYHKNLNFNTPKPQKGWKKIL
jgi:hypothetical protein